MYKSISNQKLDMIKQKVFLLVIICEMMILRFGDPAGIAGAHPRKNLILLLLPLHLLLLLLLLLYDSQA